MKKIHLLLYSLFIAGIVHATNVPKQSDGLQYTSSGHILLFDKSGVTIASGSHAMKVGFVNARKVEPTCVADSTATSTVLPDTLLVPNGKDGGKTTALGQVTYTNLWEGVTMEYKASRQGVYESTYLLAPDKQGQVHPDRICLAYNRDLALDQNGNLVVSYPTGTLTESAPVAWQTIEGKRVPVIVAYKLQGQNQVGFTLGAFRVGIPVTIDPTLTWNTFLGGTGVDKCTGIVNDGSGNIYVCGTTTGYSWDSWGSPIIPFNSGSDKLYKDVFVAKLTSTGTLSWNTFLGGIGDDRCGGIALDLSGNVYVIGNSESRWGKPAYRVDGVWNGFVAKLSSLGVLQWNTFFGATNTYDTQGIAIDASTNIYVCGSSSTTWGNTVVHAFSGSPKNGFVAKFNSNGALVRNTFFGESGSTVCQGIVLDASSNIFISGYSDQHWGSPINAFIGGSNPYDASDIFVAKLSPTLDLSWNTFLGGSESDHFNGIAIDTTSNLYVCGNSNATWGSPIKGYITPNPNDGYGVGFVAKLNSGGSLIWNTFLDGNFGDNQNSITLDASLNIYVAGRSTHTWGFPIHAFSGSSLNGFVGKLTSAGALNWNTFLGGSGTTYCAGIAIDASYNMYINGDSNTSWGAPLQANSGGTTDGFVSLIATIPAVSTQLETSIGTTTAICNGNIIDFGGSPSTTYGFCYSSTNTTPTTSDIVVNLGSTSTTGTYSTTINGLANGTRYYVRAFVTNIYGVAYGSVQYFNANYLAPNGLIYRTPMIYTKGTVIPFLTPTVSGGTVSTYSVSPALPAGLSISSYSGYINGTPTAVTAAANYTVTASNPGGSSSCMVNITVNDIAPGGLSYTATNIYTKGTIITTLSPAVSGGTVTNYSVSPALPAGLSISSTTGAISGAPTELATSASYTVTAANTGGSTTFAVNITVKDIIPSGLSYTTPNVYTKGTVITSLSPAVSGGAVTTYSVSPALPAGLSINSTTGVISGTPAVLATASYNTVTATNSGGSTTFSVSITVNDIIPSGLSYTATNIFTKNTVIANLNPSVSGGAVTTYSVSPALPAGLSINNSTGAISGTPTALATASNYMVTATNSGGSAMFVVSITVNDIIPGGLNYSTPNVYTIGTTITSLSPSISGGAVTTYSVSPSLPAGLSINIETGVISGTPTALATVANYTVTATNTGGSATFAVSITVNDIIPSGLNYTTPNVYTKGTVITSINPTVSGGVVTDYSVSPSLPAGLTISSTTGVISGTSAVPATASSYTVTATNSGGSTTFAVSITVNDIIPGGLSYPTPNVYTKGTTIPTINPTVSGGVVTSYSVSPALPAGLSMSSTTGAIRGTPTILATVANYTVTATNSGGSATFAVSITVNDIIPGGLNYPTPNVFTKGAVITSISPSVSGGAVTDYSVSPSLPAGLSISNTTGIISGAPAVLATSASYTVTANNSGGSATFAVSITVNDIIPSGLNYSTPNVYTNGKAITSLIPTVSGGAVTDYSVSPALPAGLSINSTTGLISGTPSILSTAAIYTVTATNSGGSVMFAISIKVNDIIPGGFIYPTPNIYTKGTVITSLIPTISGGGVATYNVNPALPAGLSINNTTGVISGTPTEIITGTNYLVTANNSGGITMFLVNITVNDIIPEGLSYTATNVFTKGTVITSLNPTVSGGAVTTYSVSPSLPAGLSISSTTGVISGTPLVLATAASYAVTATNSGGSTTFTISITVNDIIPGGLSYPTPNLYTKGTVITSLNPTVSGGTVTDYSVNPALPAGLSISITTGIISGTPTVLATAASYTVTATNSGGSTTFAVSITVNDIIPSGLNYPTPNVYTKGTVITSLSPTVSGGVVTSYSVSPSLPAGLSINSTTGVISGTPTIPAKVANYIVTASNLGGNTSCVITITVYDIIPSGLNYTTPNVFTKGTVITDLSPTIGGGAVTTYSVSPALPAGLSINITTGVISGTPTSVTAAVNYTVTATNSGGTNSFVVSITVNDIVPGGLSYPATNVFTKGTVITALSPMVSGGAITSFSISPSLSAGLSFNFTTGVISGMPSSVKAEVEYTVTATNSGGTNSFALSITVNDIIPSGLSYHAANVYTKGTVITSLIPTVSGGAVKNYDISPSLPVGLSINSTTGIISGTPTVPATVASYTVTATNTGGSTTFAVSITVNDIVTNIAPSGLSYTSPNIYTKGTVITSLSPTVGGGAVTTYSVSPALPAGLSISSTTGVISGTPTLPATE